MLFWTMVVTVKIDRDGQIAEMLDLTTVNFIFG